MKERNYQKNWKILKQMKIVHVKIVDSATVVWRGKFIALKMFLTKPHRQNRMSWRSTVVEIGKQVTEQIWSNQREDMS